MASCHLTRRSAAEGARNASPSVLHQRHKLKRESGKGLFVAGGKLALALTELGLIDEYEFVVQPRLAGHGPTLFAGLSKHVDLKLVSRREFGSGRWRCGMSREGDSPIAEWSFTSTLPLEGLARLRE